MGTLYTTGLGCGLFIAAACAAPTSPHAQLASLPPRAAPAKTLPSPPPELTTDAWPGTRREVAVRPDPLGTGDCAATTCDGRCVETSRLGTLCAKSCTADAECRTDLGYVCDREWAACLLPNTAVITPRQCPTKTPARDLTFGDSNVRADLSTPAAELAADGSLVAAPPWSPAYADETDCSDAAVAPVGTSTSTAEACATHGWLVRGRDPRDASGRRELVYALYGAGDHGLRVRASRDGGHTFSTGAIALVGTYGNAVGTPDGWLHVVTIAGGPLGAFGSAQHAVQYAASSDGGETFSQPVAVSARDELLPYFFSNPSVAVDVRRRWIYAAYVRGGRDARWDIVVAASKDGGATWKRTTVAGDGCAIHMVPNLALDERTGRLHLAYYDSEGAPGRFVHASCGPGVTRCTVHGAINSVPFATLSTTRDPKKSVGERATLVVDEQRRLLHAVWAQRVDDAGTPATRIFHAQARLNK